LKGQIELLNGFIVLFVGTASLPPAPARMVLEEKKNQN